MNQWENKNEASIWNLTKDFLSVDFLSRAPDSHPDIYQFSFMAFRFDSNESTLRLVSWNSCGHEKIEFNFLFKTCELRICIKTEFDTCKLSVPSSCETGYSLNNWLPATQYKCLLFHSNLFKINSSYTENNSDLRFKGLIWQDVFWEGSYARLLFEYLVELNTGKNL